MNRKRNFDKGIKMKTFWVSLTGSFTVYVLYFPHATGKTPESHVSGTGVYSTNMKFCSGQILHFIALG